MCLAPFGGIGGFVLKPWFGPWERNAQLCKSCLGTLVRTGVGGAEVPVSLLFADIRGSTGLGERLRPAEFSGLLSAFYRIAADAITSNDGIVDKFVGDEAIGLFIPGFAGQEYAAKAVAAGRAILEAAGAPDASAQGPIPLAGRHGRSVGFAIANG
jgi:adenylate cyclase